MNLFIIFLLFSVQVFGADRVSNHGTYVLKQRAIMLSQLEYEKNLDLLFLDPATCLRVTKENRSKVINANIQTLEEKGKLSHCQNFKFIGTRRVTKNLELQNKVVRQTMELAEPDDVGLPSKTEQLPKEASSPKPKLDEILSVSDNTVPEKPLPIPSSGGFPFRGREVLAGYEGVPYFSFSEDETFNQNFHDKDGGCCGFSYLFSNLPEGITSGSTTEGSLVGIPKKTGTYSPELSFYEISIGGWVLKYKGSLPKIKILPTPKYTVLNPLMRGGKQSRNNNADNRTRFYSSFSSAPQLTFEGYARSLNSISKGKYYFEVKLEQIKSNVFGINFAERNLYSNFEEFGLNPGYISVPTSTQYYNKSYGATLGHKIWKVGDVIRVAIDMDSKKIWYGSNGEWFQKNPQEVSKPESGTGPGAVLPPNVSRVWPSFEAGTGTIFTVNFGDQQFKYNPPSGFTGIPYDPSELDPLPNSWEANSMSAESIWLQGTKGGNYKTISAFNSMAMGRFVTGNLGGKYISTHMGDAVSAIEKKKSGKWQFEIEINALGIGSVAVGVVPDTYDTKNSSRLESELNGAGIKVYDGAIYLVSDGKLKPIDGNFNYNIDSGNVTRFTFACDLDQGFVTIYADGKVIAETKLGKSTSGVWKIAGNLNAARFDLYSLKDEMKFPVSGIPLWNLPINNLR